MTLKDKEYILKYLQSVLDHLITEPDESKIITCENCIHWRARNQRCAQTWAIVRACDFCSLAERRKDR